MEINKHKREKLRTKKIYAAKDDDDDDGKEFISMSTREKYLYKK